MSQKERKKRRLPKAIRPEEFRALIKVVPKHNTVVLTAFLLAYGSGLRLSEILSLKPQNIRGNTIEIWSGKGGVDRVVPKPKGWKGYMIEALPIRKSARSFQRNFKTACIKAKLSEHYTFHSLRHGFATRCLQEGMPINQLQLLLGHSNISTTSLYLKANPIDAIKSYEDLF